MRSTFDTAANWRPLLLTLLSCLPFAWLLAHGKGLLLLLACILALPAVAMLYYRHAIGRATLERAAFDTLLAVFLLAGVVHERLGLPLGYVLEAGLFFLLPVLWLFNRDTCRHDVSVNAFLWLFGLAHGLLLLSTFLGRSHAMAAAWQLMYNAKLPLMLLCAGLFLHRDRLMPSLRRMVLVLLLLCLPALLLEQTAPSVFLQVFGGIPAWQHNELLGGSFNKNRAIFTHSGYLAAYAAYAVITVWFLFDRSLRFFYGYAALVVLVLLLSGQRQETLGVVLGIAAVYAVKHRHNVLVWLFPAAGAVLLAWGLWLGGIAELDLFAQWGLGRGQLSERAELYVGGIRAAQQYFPLGAGLGTYGGAGAQKFDLTLFQDLGFHRFWWFRKELFLVDTYWPNLFAEGGWFCALLVLLSYLALGAGLVRRIMQPVSPLQLRLASAGLACWVFLLMNSPTSPLLTDPRGAFLAWLLIGWALITPKQEAVSP